MSLVQLKKITFAVLSQRALHTQKNCEDCPDLMHCCDEFTFWICAVSLVMHWLMRMCRKGYHSFRGCAVQIVLCILWVDGMLWSFTGCSGGLVGLGYVDLEQIFSFLVKKIHCSWFSAVFIEKPETTQLSCKFSFCTGEVLSGFNL